MKQRIKMGILLFLLLTACCGCSGWFVTEEGTKQSAQQQTEPVTREIFAMDTVMQLTIYDEGEQVVAVMDEAVQKLQRYEELFSVSRENSDVARLNRANGGKVTVSEDTYELIGKSIQLSKETDGLFDISIYPLVKLWGFTTQEYHIPDKEEQNLALSKVDYTKIKLLPECQVQLQADMEIDLGAIAKGYVSQKIMDFFREKKIRSAVVSLGGNVQTLGTKPDGTPFCIGIAEPSEEGSVYCTVEVQDRAVVTSGIYQRYFTKEGKNYHHIMDKRTGQPAENGLMSVTVIAKDGTAADALATALYVMGEEKARQYQSEHPEIAIILIRKDGTFWQSEEGNMQRSK